jgi:CubicO group peptidase (beta-lactamase class C family)
MSGVDEVFGNPSWWALGYSVGLLGSTAYDSAFGMGGAGGSFAYGDTATGVAFGLTKNRLSSDFNTATQISQIVTKSVTDS